MSVAARRCLVLNADYRPLASWPLSLIDARDAVSAIWRERVTVVEPWPGEFFRSPSLTMPVPKTIALREFAHVHGNPKFCRRSILLRDGYKCQYCGERFDSQDLTYDHLTPRSRGGKTQWNNIVSACLKCNAEQGDKPAREKHPLRHPRQPTNFELLEAGLRFLPNDVRETWRDFLYWNVPLDEA